MSWMLENPLFLVAIGGVTATLLGFFWLQTGEKRLIYATVAVALLTITGLVVERAVTTPREAVRQALFAVADAVERNDVDGVLASIHASMDQARRRASTEMPFYVFESVSIKQNLEIIVDADATPAAAEATFNVVVVVSSRGGTIKSRRVPRYVEVSFIKEGDQWLISDYRHDDAQVGFQKQSAR